MFKQSTFPDRILCFNYDSGVVRSVPNIMTLHHGCIALPPHQLTLVAMQGNTRIDSVGLILSLLSFALYFCILSPKIASWILDIFTHYKFDATQYMHGTASYCKPTIRDHYIIIHAGPVAIAYNFNFMTIYCVDGNNFCCSHRC